jgi:hypothetical protein
VPFRDEAVVMLKSLMSQVERARVRQRFSPKFFARSDFGSKFNNSRCARNRARFSAHSQQAAALAVVGANVFVVGAAVCAPARRV